jgi:hypothetical protein
MHFRVSNRVRLIMSLRAQERSVCRHNARLAKRLAAAQIDMQRSSPASDLLDIVGLNSLLWAARGGSTWRCPPGWQSRQRTGAARSSSLVAPQSTGPAAVGAGTAPLRNWHGRVMYVSKYSSDHAAHRRLMRLFTARRALNAVQRGNSAGPPAKRPATASLLRLFGSLDRTPNRVEGSKTLVGVAGFEPTAASSRTSRHASHVS